MNPRRLLQTVGASLVALVICSCEEYPPYAPGMYPRAEAAGWWNDEGASGSAKIVVHIGEQKAIFFRGGYAMHQGYVPPFAASHGCIRLPGQMAVRFFENAPVGTLVTVAE